MPAVKAKELARQLQLQGARVVNQQLREALEKRELRPEDFSIRDLAEQLVPDGREFVAALNPGKSGGISLLEAGNAVDTSQFANITGQIVYSKILEEYHDRAFTFSALIPNVPTQFNGEKIAGIGGIGDEAEIVQEGMPYPTAGLNEDYIETPVTVKRGMMVPVTKEAVFFDRTNLVLKRAGEVGYWLGLNKEKRACDIVVDENTTTHRYKWRGTVIATYDDNTGAHTWDNLAASNALEDWTDIRAAENLLAAMLDPNTGEPIMVMSDTLIVTPELEAEAYRIVNATRILLHAGGYATSGLLSDTDAANPIGPGRDFSGRYQVVTSRMLPVRLATNTSWFLGSPRKAFAYMENWPLSVVQAPPNSEAEFTSDIVTRFKASERGAYATIEPRFMVKSTA